MTDDPGKTHYIPHEALRSLRDKSSAECSACEEKSALVRALQEQIRRKVAEDDLRDLQTRETARRASLAESSVQAREHLLTRERLITAEILQHVPSGVSVWKPGGKLYYQNPAATEIIDLAIHAETTTLEEVSDQLGLTYDSEGSILSLDDWPLARALRGETVTNYPMTVNGIPILTCAYPLKMPTSTALWAILIYERIEL